ncbi:hypothetical protein R5R35_005694 [Gryllus longicercus]|uniref:Exonuclease domain-containing protein n=2 Tax=Gryllus longicercus TaxID=2509291 RepID=A0AAN9W0W2_9ORTH
MQAGVMASRSINTFVFLDLETTGLPSEEHNKTKITELALVAASRENINATPCGIPRVTHKLTLCCNPFRMINPTATNVTGLSNEMLEKEKTFDADVCDMINVFLSRQIPPVCLVAHNGIKFDFPILQSAIMNADKILPDDTLCVDSLPAFKELFSQIPLDMLPTYTQKLKMKSVLKGKNNDIQKDTCNENGSTLAEDRSFMQQINERTPEQNKQINAPLPEVLNTIKAKRQLFSDDANESLAQLNSFKLKDIYKFLFGRNAINCHRAENDALTLLACISILGEYFMKWCDTHAVPFNNVKKLR